MEYDLDSFRRKFMSCFCVYHSILDPINKKIDWISKIEEASTGYLAVGKLLGIFQLQGATRCEFDYWPIRSGIYPDVTHADVFWVVSRRHIKSWFVGLGNNFATQFYTTEGTSAAATKANCAPNLLLHAMPSRKFSWELPCNFLNKDFWYKDTVFFYRDQMIGVLNKANKELKLDKEEYVPFIKPLFKEAECQISVL